MKKPEIDIKMKPLIKPKMSTAEINKVAENLTNYLMEDNNNQIDQ